MLKIMQEIDDFNENTYCTFTWPTVENVLTTFLNFKYGEYTPVQYDEIYWLAQTYFFQIIWFQIRFKQKKMKLFD